MLVSRLSDTEQSNWSYTKFETTYQKPTSSPRMSNHFDTPLSTPSDWQGQYSYLPPGESSIFSQPFESANDGAEASRARPASNGTACERADLSSKKSNASDQKRALDPLGIRSAKPPTPVAEHPEPQHSDPIAPKTEDSGPDESLGSVEAPTLPMPPKALHAVRSAGQLQGSQSLPPINVERKEEEDELLEDEDMRGAGEAADDNVQPQTAAERIAQRRKMKRFR